MEDRPFTRRPRAPEVVRGEPVPASADFPDEAACPGELHAAARAVCSACDMEPLRPYRVVLRCTAIGGDH